jgi:hypothetical protein
MNFSALRSFRPNRSSSSLAFCLFPLPRHVMDSETVSSSTHSSQCEAWFSVIDSCARRSDDTKARYREGAQSTDTEHLRAGSRQTAKDYGRKPGVSLLARSKRGTRFRTASLSGGTKQRRRQGCLGASSSHVDPGRAFASVQDRDLRWPSDHLADCRREGDRCRIGD